MLCILDVSRALSHYESMLQLITVCVKMIGSAASAGRRRLEAIIVISSEENPVMAVPCLYSVASVFERAEGQLMPD